MSLSGVEVYPLAGEIRPQAPKKQLPIGCFFLELVWSQGRSRVMRMIRDSGRTNIVHTIAKKSDNFTNSGLSASFSSRIPAEVLDAVRQAAAAAPSPAPMQAVKRLQRLQAPGRALRRDILLPEGQIHRGKGVEDQRRDGVAAEERDTPVIAEQRLGKVLGAPCGGLLRLPAAGPGGRPCPPPCAAPPAPPWPGPPDSTAAAGCSAPFSGRGCRRGNP